MLAVRVRGGLGKQALSMRAMAAVQLPWQSIKVEMMPPLMMPGKAQYLGGMLSRASRPLVMRKDWRWRPSGWAGPGGGGVCGWAGVVGGVWVGWGVVGGVIPYEVRV
jgi:hypothetical protein